MSASDTRAGWSHDGLLEDLAAHLTKPDRMVWCDMQLGPAGSPRPDVFVMRKSYSNPEPRAYEIKVSMSDFRADVTAGKAMGYLKYGGAVVFAVPDELARLVKPELPGGAGLMARSARGWRTVKKPTQSPVKLPEEALLKMLIDGVERERRAYRAEQASAYAITRRLREDIAKLVRRAISEPEALEEKLERAKQRTEAVIKDQEQARERALAELRRSVNSEIRLVAKDLGLEIGSEVSRTHYMRVGRELRKRIEQADADERVRRAESTVRHAAATLGRTLEQLQDVAGTTPTPADGEQR